MKYGNCIMEIMLNFLWMAIGYFGTMGVFKFLVWFRTLIYSTLLFPKIIDLGEGQFTIKVYGRILFFIPYYMGSQKWYWSYNFSENTSVDISSAYVFHFAVNDPENIIKDYLRRFETKVYNKLYVNNKANELTLNEYKKQLNKELVQQFATDEIDYDTFIKKTNEINTK